MYHGTYTLNAENFTFFRSQCLFSKDDMIDSNKLVRDHLCNKCRQLPKEVVVTADGLYYCKECIEEDVDVVYPVTIQSLINDLVENGAVDQQFLRRWNDINLEDASESVKHIIEQAENGSVKHMSILGRWYIFGEKEGVDGDEFEAFKWCKQAADAGDVDGIAYLGYCYIHGFGVERNFDDGFELLVDASGEGSGRCPVSHDNAHKKTAKSSSCPSFVHLLEFAAYTLGCCYHSGLVSFAVISFLACNNLCL